jgi:single-strand DNA-binding protein
MAKKGINQANIMGTLGQDPEIKYMPNGDAVCNMSVATSETWKDKQTGEDREDTEWHKVVLFRRLAEIAGEYLAKGCKVFVSGKIKTRSWEKDGVKHYMTQVIGDDMQIVTFKEGNTTMGTTQNQAGGYQPGAGTKANVPQPQSQGNVFDDDIPF